MHDYLSALIGGSMIGLAAVLLMATQGRIMGVSGIASRLLPPLPTDWDWRLAFIAGVVFAPAVFFLLTGSLPEVDINRQIPLLVFGGLAVGLGTIIGNGCTSGHGVCGLSRFSKRSLFATAVFMVSAIATVWIIRHLFTATTGVS